MSVIGVADQTYFIALEMLVSWSGINSVVLVSGGRDLKIQKKVTILWSLLQHWVGSDFRFLGKVMNVELVLSWLICCGLAFLSETRFGNWRTH